MKFVCTAAGILLLWFGCTENPFSGDEDIADNRRSISGTITLDQHPVPAGIYCWIEAFDIGSFSDSLGDFTLELPAPAAQPGGGLSGTFRLYFYAANYLLDSAEVAVHQGELLLGQGDLDEEGHLKNIVHLHQILDISLSITPASIPRNVDGEFVLNTTLQATFVPSVQIITFGDDTTDNVYVSGSIFRPIDDPDAPASTIFGAVRLATLTIDADGQQFSADYPFPRCLYDEGEYELIPYIWVIQENLPPALVESLGAAYQSFTIAYEAIPFIGRNQISITVGPEAEGEGIEPCPE